jgi:hypothetical protein
MYEIHQTQTVGLLVLTNRNCLRNNNNFPSYNYVNQLGFDVYE